MLSVNNVLMRHIPATPGGLQLRNGALDPWR
jgi:hypothetical protein